MVVQMIEGEKMTGMEAPDFLMVNNLTGSQLGRED